MSKDKTTGYEPQGVTPEAPTRRKRMIPAEQVEVQLNVQIPQGLKWAVEDYQEANDLPTKREAFIELIQAGLSAKAAKKVL